MRSFCIYASFREIRTNAAGQNGGADLRAIDSPQIYEKKRGPCEMKHFMGRISYGVPKTASKDAVFLYFTIVPFSFLSTEPGALAQFGSMGTTLFCFLH